MLVGTNNHVEMLLLCLMLLGPQVFTFCQTTCFNEHKK